MSRQVGAKRRQYDLNSVNEAAKLVTDGSLSLSQAAKSFNIPKTTLHDRVHKKYATNAVGTKPVLTEAEETRVAEWALHMSRIGYGRTRAELCHIIQKIIEADGRPNPFVNNKPGRKWLKRFFLRHPELTIRSTIQLGKERAIISQDKINKWFNDFTTYVTEELKDPNILTDPTRIYNADESGFSLCPSKSGKVIGSKGAPVVYHYGNSDKTQLTIMAAASASGHFIQPMIIFPGQRFSYNPLEGFEDAALGRSDTGWMDSEVFIGWLTNVFIPGIEARNVRKPVLLLIDGHKTHVSMEASDTCIAHGIELYCLLEHSSHVMQPLDLRFFGQLKIAWRQGVRDYQLANVGEFVTKQTFARVFKEAWMKATTIDAAIKGFLEAGLYPVNPSRVLTSVKLAPSQIFQVNPQLDDSVTKVIETDDQAVVGSVSQEDMVSDVQRPCNIVVEIEAIPNPDVPTSNSDKAMETRAVDITTSASGPDISATSATQSSSIITSCVQTNTPAVTVNASCNASSPFSKYLTLPKIKSAKPKAQRVLMPKAITGSKYRELLQEKIAKKNQEEEKQKRKQDRLKKRQQKEEETKRKKLALEKKKAEREAFKRKKEQKRANEEKILRDIEMSGSDDCIEVATSKCYKCEEEYDAFIQCSNCFRRFHFKCVEDEMISSIEELPFECKYC